MTWQDGRSALEASLRSTIPYVDEVLVAEGLVEGVPDVGLSPHSDLRWLADPEIDWLPEHIWICSRQGPKVEGIPRQVIVDTPDGPKEITVWRQRLIEAPGVAPWLTISAKMNWLLAEAKRRNCDWMLLLDADEELHNGHHLRLYLESYDAGAAAFPITRRELGRVTRTPWHLVRTEWVRRYLRGVTVCELADGRIVDLLSDSLESTGAISQEPYITHHPERRPPWRQAIRLGEYEHLEAYPEGTVRLILPPIGVNVPVVNTAAVTPEWYCPACGARYFGPGTCSIQHPPTELEHATPDDGGDPAAEVSEPEPVPNGQDSEASPHVPSSDPPAQEEVLTQEPAPTSEPAPASTSDPLAPLRSLLKLAQDDLEALKAKLDSALSHL